jgi:predicted ABC-type ATPase
LAKTLYIIAGCNGAGKTTASYTILPEIWHCQEFVNADEIARGLSPLNPNSMAVQAGRIMLQRIEELMKQRVSFSIETTLATRSYVQLVKRAQAEGYTVNLLFFWLESPEMAVQRVAKRVKEGGHDIPKDVIYRRYKLGICNFFKLYKDVADVWTLVDNASSPRRVIATDEEIKDIELYNKIEAYVNN